MRDPQDSKKIGVIVDAASFHNLMRVIGIGRANLKKLLEVIGQEVSETIQVPVSIGFAQYITAAENPDRFKKRVNLAGFKFITTDSCMKESDDDEVNRCIRLANPGSIMALIVVTADLLDYAKSLEEKRSQGIQIFIASIIASESDGHFPLSIDSRQIIKENQYTLIDLGKYKDVLLLTEWVDSGSESPYAVRTGVKSDDGMTKKLQINSDAGHLNLHEWIEARCAYLYRQINAYASKQDLGGIQCVCQEISSLVNLPGIVDISDEKAQKKRVIKETQPVKIKAINRKPPLRVTLLSKSQRRERILSVLRRHEFVSSSLLLHEIPNVEIRTLQRDLRGLEKKGLIQSSGDTCGTRYMLAPKEEDGTIDRLIDITDAAKRLGTSEDWLYHHWNEYPFSRKLSAKQLRFSISGIDAWIQTNQNHASTIPE